MHEPVHQLLGQELSAKIMFNILNRISSTFGIVQCNQSNRPLHLFLILKLNSFQLLSCFIGSFHLLDCCYASLECLQAISELGQPGGVGVRLDPGECPKMNRFRGQIALTRFQIASITSGEHSKPQQLLPRNCYQGSTWNHCKPLQNTCPNEDKPHPSVVFAIVGLWLACILKDMEGL